MDGLRFTGGRRNLACALADVCTTEFSGRRGDRSGVPNVLVVVTNGVSMNETMAIMEASKCKRRGVHIVVIAVGIWLNFYEVKNVASWPHNDTVLYVESFQMLSKDNGTPLIELICNSKQLLPKFK